MVGVYQELGGRELSPKNPGFAKCFVKITTAMNLIHTTATTTTTI